MSVNDIVTCGATPVGFVDYFGCSRLDVDLAEKVSLLASSLFPLILFGALGVNIIMLCF